MNLVWIESCLVIFINQTLTLFRDKIKLDRCFYLYYILLLHFFERLHAWIEVEATRWNFTFELDPVRQVLIPRHFCANKLLRLQQFHFEKSIHILALWIIFYHLSRRIQQFNSIFVICVILFQRVTKLAEKSLFAQITQFAQILTRNCIEKVEVSQGYSLLERGVILRI